MRLPSTRILLVWLVCCWHQAAAELITESGHNDQLGLNSAATPKSLYGKLAQLYVADNSATTINRMNIDGSGFEVLAHTNPVLLGLAVDAISGTVYWCDNGNYHDPNGRARIYRADLDGSNRETLYESVLTGQGELVRRLVVDGSAQHLYWSGSVNRTARIVRMNTDGTGVTPVIDNDPNYRGELELDPVNRKLYFNYADEGVTHIARADLDGLNRELLTEGSAYSLFLDAPGNRLLCADYFDSKVFEVDLATFERRDLFYARKPRDVVRFGDQLYYNDLYSPPDGSGILARIIRSDLDGSNPVVLRQVNRRSAPSSPLDLHVIPEPTTGAMALLALLGMGGFARCCLGGGFKWSF